MAKTSTRRGQQIPKEESKSARFVRVVTPRVNKAVKAISVIGFCAGSSYESKPAQVQQLCKLLRSTVDDLEHKFSGKAESGGSFKFME